jgi:hypothetical protein
MKNLFAISLGIGLVMPLAARAGDNMAPAPAGLQATTAPTTLAASSKFGLFDWLDKRSSYGSGAYPEPFLVDDTDLEVNEARLDWLYTNSGGTDHSHLLTGEVEKGFGQLTLEVEAPIEIDSAPPGGKSSVNWANIDVGARMPFYDYVAPSGKWDTTFGVAMEVGIPTGSFIARSTEVVPKVFNDLRIGDHFTLQSIFGYSTFVGETEGTGGQQTFEYGFVGGYTITHDQLSLPGLMQVIPMIELSGDKSLNFERTNGLTADFGLRANLKPIGDIQPRLGAAYVLPLDATAREDEHWGVITSLVFEY